MFREAGADDLRSILRLYGQLHPEDPTVTDGVALAVLERIRRADGLHLYVLEDDGAVVATTYLNVIPNLTRSAAPYAVLENVVVDQAARRRGYGRIIIERTLASAWDAGCYKVMLMTGAARPAAHAFYQACGFDGGQKTAYLARPPHA